MNREQEIKKQAEGQDGKENHLGAAELSAEQNMNMIDGIPNNEKPRVNQNYVILENEIVGEKEFVLAAYQNPPKDGGVTAAYQKQVPRKGEIPTPDELIRYMAGKVRESV